MTWSDSSWRFACGDVLSLDPELASDHLSLINVSFPFGSALCPFRSSADRADRVDRADWADRDRDQAFKKVLKNETITEFLNYWITEPNPLFKPGVRMSLGTSPADPWKWKWSNGVGKSEMSIIWCIGLVWFALWFMSSWEPSLCLVTKVDWAEMASAHSKQSKTKPNQITMVTSVSVVTQFQ